MRKTVLSIVVMCLFSLLASCSVIETDMSGDINIVFDSKVKAVDSNISMVTEEYEVTFEGPDGEILNSTVSKNTTVISKKGLSAGEWTITVDALNPDGIVIGRGSTKVEIRANKTTNANIIVNEIEGEGTLSVSVYGGNSVLSYTLEIYKNNNGSDVLVKSQEFSYVDDILKADVTLPNGFYSIKVVSSSENEESSVPLAVRIVAGDSITASFTITQCNGNVSITVNNRISSAPEINLVFSSNAVHEGESITVKAEGTEEDNYSYEWYLDNKRISGESSALVLDGFSSTGDHIVTCIVRSKSSILTWDVSKVLTIHEESYKPGTIIISGDVEFYLVSDVLIPEDIEVGIYRSGDDSLIGNYSPHFTYGFTSQVEVYGIVINKEGYYVYFEDKYIVEKNITLVYVVIDKDMSSYGYLDIKSEIYDELDGYAGYYCWQSFSNGYIPLPIYNDVRSVKIPVGTYSINRNKVKGNYNHIAFQAFYDKNSIKIKEGESTELTVRNPHGRYILKSPDFEEGKYYHVWVRRNDANLASCPFKAEDNTLYVDVSSSYYSYDSILIWDNNSEYNSYSKVEGFLSDGEREERDIEFVTGDFVKYESKIPEGRYKVDTDTVVLLKENVPASIFWKLKNGDTTYRNFCANLMNVRTGSLPVDSDFYYFNLLKSEYTYTITSSILEDSYGEYTLIKFTFDKEMEESGELIVKYDLPSDITLSDTCRAAIRVLKDNSDELNIMVKSSETRRLKAEPGTYTYNGVWSWITDLDGNSYKAILDTDTFTIESGESTTVTVKFERYN